MATYELPVDLRYTAEHQWVRLLGDGRVRVGLTGYAQGELGEVVLVQLPQVGERLQAGTTCGELESTRALSDLYAPLSGVVSACNEALDGSPELVNSDPYGDGWVLEVALDDARDVAQLLDAAGYGAQIG